MILRPSVPRLTLFKQGAEERLGLVARRDQHLDPPTSRGSALPPVMAEIASYDQGIVILAGVTGSSKSTDDRLDAQLRQALRDVAIVTIEDPIEFTFTDDESMIHQREVGIDVLDWDASPSSTPSGRFGHHPRGRDARQGYVPRGDAAARDGHLVFGTIHASSCLDHRPNPRPLPPRDALGDQPVGVAFNLAKADSLAAEVSCRRPRNGPEDGPDPRADLAEGIMRTSPDSCGS